VESEYKQEDLNKIARGSVNVANIEKWNEHEEKAHKRSSTLIWVALLYTFGPQVYLRFQLKSLGFFQLVHSSFNQTSSSGLPLAQGDNDYALTAPPRQSLPFHCNKMVGKMLTATISPVAKPALPRRPT
jgi:hypothetical protein